MAPLKLAFLALVALAQSMLLLVGAAPAADETSPAPFVKRGAKCTSLRLRVEWRDMTVSDRQAYIRAVKCLQTTPSKSMRQGVKSRFDEFQGCHVDLTDEVHQVGHFLPWHRHFMNLYNQALREECGYTGPGTYWDWTRDADSTKQIKDSPIFDPDTGFGGNGVPGTYTPPPSSQPGFPGFPMPGAGQQGCVQTGPFKDAKVGLGPGRAVGEHCLVRGIGEGMKSSCTSANVRTILTRTTFESFRTSLENGGQGISGMGIHGGGHGLVGGEMMDPYSSPGDPLFYLHHSNLDRIWWHWQQADPANRLNAISGPTLPRSNTNVTLSFLMPFTSISAPVAIGEVMDLESEPSCFRYND